MKPEKILTGLFSLTFFFFFFFFYQKEPQSTSSLLTNYSLWQPESTDNKALFNIFVWLNYHEQNPDYKGLNQIPERAPA